MKKHGSSPQSVTTPRTLSPSRRQKLEMIQKRENAKHHSARMEAILKKKMLASCGIQEGKTNAKLCRAIDAAIHAFVIENLADNGSGGLSMLEKYIKALVSATRTPQRQEPLQNMEDDAVSKCGSLTAEVDRNTEYHEKDNNVSMPSNSSCNEVVTEDDSEGIHSLIRNWRALDVIGAIEHNKAQEAEKDNKQKSIQQRKADFKKSQALRATKKIEIEKEKREECEHLEESLQEWKLENETARQKVKMHHEEESIIRKAHIAEAGKKRDIENRKMREYEQMLIQRAKDEVEMEKAKAEARRRQECKLMEDIKAENKREREHKKQQALKAAEEDFRLTREHVERAEREEARRQAVLEERIKRYEVIGDFWQNTGAGKKQREEELRAERLTLEQAARKEAAQAKREANEAKQKRDREIQVAKENALQQEQRKLAKQMQDEEDQHFAKAYVADAEAYQKAQELQKRKKEMEAKKYQEQLEMQIKETEKRRQYALTDMSDVELSLNMDKAKRLLEDPELQKQVKEALTSKPTVEY